MHRGIPPIHALPTCGDERMRRPMRNAQTGLRMNGLHGPVNAVAARHLLPTSAPVHPIARDL
jgi:hypothetical protein